MISYKTILCTHFPYKTILGKTTGKECTDSEPIIISNVCAVAKTIIICWYKDEDHFYLNVDREATTIEV